MSAELVAYFPEDYTVDCPACGQVDLGEQEFNRQLNRPGPWHCPRCKGPASREMKVKPRGVLPGG